MYLYFSSSVMVVAGIHVDYPNDEGQSPLFCASLKGHADVVEYLLSAGADPNEYDICTSYAY